MKIVRIAIVAAAVFAGVAGLAIAVTASSTDRSDEIDGALLIADLNEESAESAPQQQVINGWTARDLLEIQANQLNDIEKAQSQTTLLLGLLSVLASLGIVAVVLNSRPQPTPSIADLASPTPPTVSPATPPVTAPSVGDDAGSRAAPEKAGDPTE